ncbi:MAG: permease, partial [Myxococcota bacterium]
TPLNKGDLMDTVLQLLSASLGLLVGPICSSGSAPIRPIHAFVVGFALALVGCMCFIFVVPHSFAVLGWAAAVTTLAGALMPVVARRFWKTTWSLAAMAIAMSAYVFLNGATMTYASALPIGFALVVVANTLHQRKTYWALAGSLVVATCLGYFLGAPAKAWLPAPTPYFLEALLAGLLLNVVFNYKAKTKCEGHHAHSHEDHHHHSHERHQHAHNAHSHEAHQHAHNAHSHNAHSHEAHQHEDHRHTDHDHATASDDRSTSTWGAASGTLAGLLTLFAYVTQTAPDAVERNVSTFLTTLSVLVLESAPALLIGYAMAGLMPFLLTSVRMESLNRKSRLQQSLRGVAFGLPMPVCSCGVLPLYESLIRRGAPPVAALAFFIATPELGLDAVLLSVPLLGLPLTIARVAAAFVVALLVAVLVGTRLSSASSTTDSTPERPDSRSLGARVRAGLHFGFVEVFDHTMPWISLGLIIAAMAEPLLSHGAIQHIPAAVQVPVAAMVGIPVYVCASGATPVAALALHKGLSAGAAIAFLIAGPATNITTFGVLARLHGRKTAIIFGGAVTLFAVLAGWSVDAFGVATVPLLEAQVDSGAHESPFAWLCVGILVVLAVASLYRQGPRGALRQIIEPIHAH